MALRVSRQMSEVLAEGDGDIRVSRQHVEVLVLDQDIFTVAGDSTLSLVQSTVCLGCRLFTGASTLNLTSDVAYIGPKFVDAESFLVLGQEIYIPQIYEVSANNLIDLGQETAIGGTRRPNAESILVLGQVGDNIIKVRSADNTLALTHVTTVESVKKVVSYLTLTHEALPGKLAVTAVSTLNLQQNVRLDPLPQFAESQLSMNVDAEKSLHSLNEGNTLVFGQVANVTKPIRVSAESELTKVELVYNEETYGFDLVDTGLRHSATVAPQLGLDSLDYLSFSQIATPGHVKAAGTSVSSTSTITFTHSAILSLTGDGTSTLTLGQTAFGQAGVPIGNQLVLTQTATFTIDRTQTATSVIPFSQAAAYTLILASTKCQYSPFIGSSSDPNAPTPPSTEIDGPMVGIQVPFQLVYPSTGAVTDAVSLSTPNLGNLDRLSFDRIQRETRGGTLIVYSDPNWPKIQTLVLSFSGLLNVEAQALLTFMDEYLGQEIGLIDWEHRFWRGVIITPEEPIVEDRFDSFTASFSFEGELDSTWNPQVVPPTLRYSATRTPREGGYYVCDEPVIPCDTGSQHSAEAGAIIKIGYPLYLSGGLVYPAQSNAAGTTQVVGVSINDVAAGISCSYITEGSITRSNWTDIAGTVGLSSGATYFLDPTTAGRITTTAPTTAGQYVVRIGRAVNATTLDVEIELPILL
jgi:hypothetical protein